MINNTAGTAIAKHLLKFICSRFLKDSIPKCYEESSPAKKQVGWNGSSGQRVSTCIGLNFKLEL